MSTEQPSIPTTSFHTELVPGRVKNVKSANRRADAMSWMDPHAIQIMRDFNARIRTPAYLDHLRSTTDSMKTEGFHIDKPISVYVANEGGEDVVYVVDGHTRLEAALTAIDEGSDFDTIPVVILPKSLNMVDMTVGLYRSNAGQPLTPYETALVAKRLECMGLTEADISRRLDLSPPYINGLLLLAAAPLAIAHMVIEGELAASEAISVLRERGDKAVEALERAKNKAQQAGKTKVTAAHMPGAAFKKAVKKAAPRLLKTAKNIREDPGYSQLGEQTRSTLESLLEELEQLERSDEDETEGSITTSGGNQERKAA